MSYSRLENKEKIILNLTVASYLETGKPVSSGLLAQKLNFKISPATIRNAMASLEKEGYLFQPHTSAGRLPTDEGIRFYVNTLLVETLRATPDDLRIYPEELNVGSGELDSLLLQVSQILASSSDNLAFVISPNISRVTFDQVRFVKLKDNRVMIVLLSTFNLVQTEIFETQALFTQTELDRAAQYLNQNFRGKSLSHVRDYLFRELPRLKMRYEDLVEKLLTLLRSYPALEKEEGKIFLQGTARLLDKAELFDFNKLKSLFQNFEEKANLARLLSDLISLERVKVIIGSELKLPEIADCSLILSHYGYRNKILGSLGIIGPKRLPYDRIIPLVDNVARRLTRAITILEKGVEL
ncbi:MAG: heat-inducible transcriptional repressor HrcA [Candidatus Saccharicenans sp.]|nr:heat-inducible transcriptional repressor HrcA [Candidatus Saccharicenans sp.]MDI6849776.1 heat-inducible transcriptional repressor HrcA [Candidatus Saccharicenans sp.]